MTIAWTAIKPYLRKYWWVIVVGVVIAFIDRLGGVIESYHAYKNPQTKIVFVTKTVKQRDVVHTRETIIQKDGTKIIKERTEDKSREVNDTEKQEDKTPVLPQRQIRQKISLSVALADAETELGYDLYWKSLSVGVDVPLTETPMDGASVSVGLSF